MSPSISKVFIPEVAKEIAKLREVDVFPSPGTAEVKAITFGGFSALTYCKFVRNCLNDSVLGA